ncbi:unnamed protein product [Moneuplotes crassus]|uniref:Uncharacterized protein n=2 Tax=Euplotes crassus TaxID=5936 RepID=A0AAD1UPX4_EUPCR|nr:unnamed protein product [Moneuplotes crassus]
MEFNYNKEKYGKNIDDTLGRPNEQEMGQVQKEDSLDIFADSPSKSSENKNPLLAGANNEEDNDIKVSSEDLINESNFEEQEQIKKDSNATKNSSSKNLIDRNVPARNPGQMQIQENYPATGLVIDEEDLSNKIKYCKRGISIVSYTQIVLGGLNISLHLLILFIEMIDDPYLGSDTPLGNDSRNIRIGFHWRTTARFFLIIASSIFVISGGFLLKKSKDILSFTDKYQLCLIGMYVVIEILDLIATIYFVIGGQLAVSAYVEYCLNLHRGVLKSYERDRHECKPYFINKNYKYTSEGERIPETEAWTLEIIHEYYTSFIYSLIITSILCGVAIYCVRTLRKATKIHNERNQDLEEGNINERVR